MPFKKHILYIHTTGVICTGAAVTIDIIFSRLNYIAQDTFPNTFNFFVFKKKRFPCFFIIFFSMTKILSTSFLRSCIQHSWCTSFSKHSEIRSSRDSRSCLLPLLFFGGGFGMYGPTPTCFLFLTAIGRVFSSIIEAGSFPLSTSVTADFVLEMSPFSRQSKAFLSLSIAIDLWVSSS